MSLDLESLGIGSISAANILAVAGPALVAIAAVIARQVYVRKYLCRRLFFEPWLKHSGDKNLDIGASLAELLYFELERIRQILKRAEADVGLWNERTNLPIIERAVDGGPTFITQVELLGLPGKITSLVRFILMARPPMIRGTIHRFGELVRCQIVMEGLRAGGRRSSQIHCWAASRSVNEPASLPDMVSELAHRLVLDLEGIRAFKSAASFRDYTRGLEQHLNFNENHGRKEFGEEARNCYLRVIQQEGQSPHAAYALGLILYSAFRYEENEEAIRFFQQALQTDLPKLRLKAFRGLADAYCQRRHRHRPDDEDALECAVRWARFAEELYQTVPDAPDEATIKKALAFATQIQSEKTGIDPREKEEKIAKAMTLYEQAIHCAPRFTVAYNNLGYLYLERAKRTKKDGQTDWKSKAREDLGRAQTYCEKAIECNPTLALAYDNLGNICVELAEVADGEEWSALEKAENHYHKAIAYRPLYSAAYQDLANLQLRFLHSANGSAGITVLSQRDYLRRAWHYHWQSLSTLSDDKSRQQYCREFQRKLDGLGGQDWADNLDEGCKDGLQDVKCVCRLESKRPTQQPFVAAGNGKEPST